MLRLLAGLETSTTETNAPSRASARARSGPRGKAAALCLVAALTAGCGNARSADPPREHAAAHTRTPSAPPTGSASAPTTPAPAGDTWDAQGITIERLPDGSIRMRGQDRWGVQLDTTYADATYFANAVPVLARSLTEAQARALTEAVPSIRGAAAAGSAAP